MKILLIGIYLAHGSLIPSMQFDSVEVISECRIMANTFVKRAVKDQAWAICAKVKGESK